MNLNSDAVQNVKHKIIRWESGYFKTAAEIAQGAGILSPDNYFSGIVAEMEVGVTVAVMDFLAYGNTANALVLADASDATLPCMAVALEAGVDGDMVKVLLYGYIKSADSLFGTQASQILTVAANCLDNETFTIGTNIYEITVDGTVTAGNIAVEDVPGTPTAGVLIKADIPGFMAREINAHDGQVTAVDNGDFTMTITATKVDIAATANAIATTETGSQLSWGAATMAGGVNGTTIFLSDTGGDFALATGTKTQAIGRSLSMRELMFNPDPYIEE